ncbi:MAG: hypothetical protein WC804_18395 [Sphingomonas sp.]|jgi:hypothetical protein|uniref:hypothetical protein n=1 Tax=Sphingomonas sp. TaxID=28214 RepID=UPI003562C45A
MTATAQAQSRNLGSGGVFIEHATLTEADLVWLATVERLVLWDVSVPSDFLARLPSLWWIDWRGGSVKQGISHIQSCQKLRYLALNQIRGLSDLIFIMNLTALEMINFYGLSKVVSLPSMSKFSKLRRAQLGQMKSLPSIGAVLSAPNLQELQLHNHVGVSSDDVQAMRDHPNLSAFEWFGENIPVKMWEPVRKAVGLPLAKAMHPEEWFGLPH